MRRRVGTRARARERDTSLCKLPSERDKERERFACRLAGKRSVTCERTYVTFSYSVFGECAGISARHSETVDFSLACLARLRRHVIHKYLAGSMKSNFLALGRTTDRRRKHSKIYLFGIIKSLPFRGNKLFFCRNQLCAPQMNFQAFLLLGVHKAQTIAGGSRNSARSLLGNFARPSVRTFAQKSRRARELSEVADRRRQQARFVNIRCIGRV